MPITGNGWELLITRQSEQQRIITLKSGSKRRYVRTVGVYKIYHDGQIVRGLSGMMAEARGPGDNSKPGNGRRIEAAAYPLLTSDGPRYMTHGFNSKPVSYPRPGLELRDTGNRSAILIHPGHGFLASIGCINPCSSLPNGKENIDLAGSHARVAAIIDDLKAYLGKSFPKTNGKRIPGASVVIDGEP